MRRLRLVAGLAMRDLLHERGLAFCSVVGLAAVLLPLLVLFGLKHGVMQGLREDLIENPRARMVVNAANRNYDEAFIVALAVRPDVAFVVGRIRSISADARLFTEAAPDTPVRTELWSTGPGDPLLGGAMPLQPLEVVLSRSLAAALGAAPGQVLTLRASRGAATGGREVLNLRVSVAGIAPAAAVERNVAFVDPRLLRLVDGFVDRELEADTDLAALSPVPDRPYAGFRAHARRLEDVPRIDAALRAQGHEVETRAHEVSALLDLDRSLGLLFALIAGLGGAGYLVSLGVGLYADVERKRRQLSHLRMLGLRRGEMVLLPVLQAGMVGLAGAGLAALGSLLVAAAINGLDLSQAGGRAVAVIAPWHLGAALGVTLAGAWLAAVAAGVRAGRVAPAEGIRDE